MVRDDEPRKCRCCGEVKPSKSFPKNGAKSHRLWRCYLCRDHSRPEQRRQSWRRKSQRLRQSVLVAYGPICSCCGETTPEFLTLDHIGNTGAAHKREVGGGTNRVYLAVRREGFPKDKYRILCFNCNCSLGFLGYCPHRPDVTYPVAPRGGKAA